MKKLSTKKCVINTASGRELDILNPDPDSIKLLDIINGLSKLCRFNGQIPVFFSVAQHSMLVAQLVSKELEIAALMHDAEEAYIGDMTRPLKMHFPEFDKIADNLRKAIWQKLEIDYSIYKEIEEADNKILKREFEFFFNGKGELFLMPQDVIKDTFARYVQTAKQATKLIYS